MVQDSWVRVSFPVRYFISFFCYPFFSSSPKSASNAQVGIRGFALYPLLPLFFLALFTRLFYFSLFLAVMLADHAVTGYGNR